MTRVLKLIAKGFKSFGKHSELVFGEKFNVILGPNGSGKSNVLDAFCFVLGKAGAKGLRAEKSANLIYNGGKTKQPAKEGSVSIFFDNKDKTFNTEGDTVKVTRIIRNSGNSVYKINDKTMTRQQVLDLLSRANINPDGYNIILQGDITSLVEMSTNDRRQIIEEIAGIGIYEEKKLKALNELEKVEKKLEEASIILTERGTYLKDLKKDRDQAQKAKHLQDQIDTNKATFLHYKIESTKEAMHKHDKSVLDNDKKLKEYLAEIEKLKKGIEESRKQLDALAKEIEDKGEKEQVELHKLVENLKVEMGTSSQRIEFCRSEIQRSEARSAQFKESQEELTAKIREKEKEKQDYKKEVAAKKKMLEQLQGKIRTFKEKNKMDVAGDLEKDIEKIEKDAEKVESALSALRQQMQDKIREKDRLEFQLQGIDDKIRKVQDIEKEHADELTAIKQKKTEFKKATSELNKYLTEDSSLAAKLTQERNALQKAREDLSKLSARDMSIREATMSDAAISRILGQKKVIAGIIGTISDLGTVNSKYALALEVAAGHRMKSVVVESDKVAAECMRYLKTNRIGVATFLPLNKMKAAPEDAGMGEVLKAEGVHGRAVDLVQYDRSYAKVFSYVLGNTLVVDTIDVARRIGIGKFRMVTLDGSLAELSGAMRGGFAQLQASGRGFKEKELSENLAKLEKAVAETENQISLHEKRRKDIEEHIDRLRHLKAELEGEIIKSEKALHLESEDLDISKKQKQEIQADMKKVDKEIDSLNDRIREENIGLSGIKKRKLELREKITELRSPKLLAELNSYEQQKDEIEQNMRDYEAGMKSTEMQVSSVLVPEKEKTGKIIKEAEKDIRKFQDEIKQLADRIKANEAGLKENEKKEKEFRKQFKGLFDSREKVNMSIQKDENRIILREEQSRELEKKLSGYSVELAGLKAELAAHEENFERYQKKGTKLALDRSIQDLTREINEFERMADDLGFVNMRALEIYDLVEREYNSLMEKKDKLGHEKEDVIALMNEIESRKKDLFMKTFDVVNGHFLKIFNALSTKGEAYLDLEEAEKLEESGVSIKVKLSTERFMDIRSLSGGEKTLTALAFLFAIQEHEPASFYIMDEVDAALDKRNSEKLAKLIRAYCERAQYIVISHNDALISEGDTLFGVSMDEHGVTQVTSLKV